MNSSQKNNRSFLINGALAGGVLYYVLDLSSVGRTAIDWIVIALVCAAILWNVIKLGLILFHAGSSKDVFHLARMLGMWIVGLFNTAMLRPEDVGGWKNWIGGILLVLALCDSIAIWRKEQRATSAHNSKTSAE